MRTEQAEVVIVGAGPAGSVAAGLLRRRGIGVLVLEKETFPRFSIGESLLPQSMAYIEEAGMLQAVVEAGFQYKNGAAFARGDRYTDFDFREKFSPGWGTTYQVQRAHFDDVLIREAEKQGAEVRFRHVVEAVDVSGAQPVVTVRGEDGDSYAVQAKFLLDASGFGRILPRLLKLESPSNFPVRAAIYTHVADGIPAGTFDRNKIRVGVHPEHDDVWYWTIPFSNGRCSLGVVAEKAFLDQYDGDEMAKLRALVNEDPALATLLKDAQWDTPARQIAGYAANVRSLWGNGYALLGNAGEFLDPVFSSGVTIAFKSASLAAGCLARKLAGETVDWEADFAKPLKAGVDCFRVFVEAWYAGRFQRVLFHPDSPPEIRGMISSILAGYAWDTSNPFVADARRRLGVVEQLCGA